MMNFYGNDFRYASSRIDGTIVIDTKKGEPFYVVATTDDRGGTCVGAYLKDLPGNTGRVPPLSSHEVRKVPLDIIDCNQYKLGFADSVNGACFIARKPMRGGGYKQGLRSDNWCSLWGQDRRGLTWRQLRDCLNNTHMNIDLCMEESFNHPDKVPFSFDRDWSIRHVKGESFDVCYKYHDKVGDLLKSQVELSPKFSYLTEALAEVL